MKLLALKSISLLIILSHFNIGFSQQNSIHFDGTNDFVNCGNNGSLNITGNSICLEAWIYPTSFQANVWQGNVINKNGAGDNGYMLRVGNGGQVNFNLGTGWWNEINSAVGAVTLNNWHHIAGTYDGTTMRLYVDGVEVANAPENQNIGSASNNLFLGEDPQWTGRYFPGRIEEVKIWNTTRSANQVANDMNTDHCSPLPAGLVAYYRFNQGVSNGNNAGLTNVIDETGVNNGTLTNSSLNGVSSNWVGGRPAFPAPSASFSLSLDCGGATSTITGTPDGLFAFNPNPGDASILNASTGLLTNGIVGTTYFIEYSVCGISSIESVTVLEDNCWTLNGDAQYINVAGEQCIQLTDEINNQTGCAWNGTPVDFASDFTLTLDYYFGNNVGGADGNTFTFQPGSSTSCGQNGGQLGAGGLVNALSIEFDTYDNDFPTHLYDMLCDHIAVEIDGSMQFAAPLCGPVCAKAGGGNIDDGGVYTVDIEWVSGSNTLNIYFDGDLRLTCVNDFVTNAFAGTSQVYWGATSATGGLNNQQYFCPSTIVILPIELGSFTSECDGVNEVFNWTTITEDRVDYFQLEYTYDGLVFYPYGQVKAIGDSQEELHYSLTVASADKRQRYYRLKIVDLNGNFEYTDIIASRMCTKDSGLISTVILNPSSIQILSKEDVKVQIVNQLGQVIYMNESYKNNTLIDANRLETGLYLIHVQTSKGESETRRIIYVN